MAERCHSLGGSARTEEENIIDAANRFSNRGGREILVRNARSATGNEAASTFAIRATVGMPELIRAVFKRARYSRNRSIIHGELRRRSRRNGSPATVSGARCVHAIALP